MMNLCSCEDSSDSTNLQMCILTLRIQLHDPSDEKA